MRKHRSMAHAVAAVGRQHSVAYEAFRAALAWSSTSISISTRTRQRRCRPLMQRARHGRGEAGTAAGAGQGARGTRLRAQLGPAVAVRQARLVVWAWRPEVGAACRGGRRRARRSAAASSPRGGCPPVRRSHLPLHAPPGAADAMGALSTPQRTAAAVARQQTAAVALMRRAASVEPNIRVTFYFWRAKGAAERVS